jgi:hypothetical protein
MYVMSSCVVLWNPLCSAIFVKQCFFQFCDVAKMAIMHRKI